MREKFLNWDCVMRGNLLWLVGALAGAILTVPSSAQGDQIEATWVARAQREAPESVERYSSLLKNLDEAVTLTSKFASAQTDKAPGREQTIRIMSSCLNRNSMVKTIRVFDDGSQPPAPVIQMRNPLYSCTLTQAKVEKSYLLRDYQKATDSEAGEFEVALCSEVYQDLRRLLDALKGSNGHQLTTLRQESGTPLLYAAFTMPQQRGPTTTTQTRELWIDTSSPWRLIRRAIRTPGSQVVRTSITYGPSIDGLPLPSQIVEETNRPGSPPGRIEMTFTVGKTTKHPEDFRLSAFGLPEPVDTPEVRKRYTHFWLGGAAIACALLALLLRRVGRRAGAANSVTESKP